MARVAGFGGQVLIGTVAQTGIKEWSLDYSVAVLDGRGFDSAGLPYPVVGPIEWGGGFAGPKDGVPITVFATVALSLGEATATAARWTGSAIITEVHPSVMVDGLVEYGYAFVGKGTLTAPTV